MLIFTSYAIITIVIRLRLPLVGAVVLLYCCFRNVNIHYKDCQYKNIGGYEISDYVRLHPRPIGSLLSITGCYAHPGNAHFHRPGIQVHIPDCNVGG